MPIAIGIRIIYFKKFYNAAVRCFFDKRLGGIYTLYKQDRKNSSVYNVCCIFEDNYIFVANFNTSSWTARFLKYVWPFFNIMQ